MKNPTELGGAHKMTMREHLAHFNKAAAASHRALAEAHGVIMAKESLGDDERASIKQPMTYTLALRPGTITLARNVRKLTAMAT
jgi:hypothetical protein